MNAERLDFIRSRVRSIKDRGYTRSDEVNLLLGWAEEMVVALEEAAREREGAKTR